MSQVTLLLCELVHTSQEKAEPCQGIIYRGGRSRVVYSATLYVISSRVFRLDQASNGNENCIDPQRRRAVTGISSNRGRFGSEQLAGLR